MNLELLLAHADDHRPTAPEGLPVESAANEPCPAQGTEPLHPWEPDGDPNDLSLQRWGVIAPEGPRGERLLALIQPLMELRQADQGGAPVRIHRAPSSLGDAEAVAWKRRALEHEAFPQTEQPRYLLLLGDFDELSFELQRVLASDSFLGRLAFRDDAGFEAYVAKVLRWERAPSPPARGRAVFHTVHDGTAATLLGYSTLVAPIISRCREQLMVGASPAQEILEIGDPIDWSPQRFLATARMEAPSLLFTLSHGLGAPRAGWSSRDAQRHLQGTMCLGGRQHLEPGDLARGPFLPGGIWFYFAGFGVGTPAASAFHPWLRRLHATGSQAGQLEAILASLPREGERPFVSALPQAALANPDGPLAVLGPMELAWSHGFQEPDSSFSRVASFLSVFRAMLAGKRVGIGLGALLRAFTETNLELARLSSFADRVRRAQLWMLRQELGAYILLGDPATRLPLERRAGGRRCTTTRAMGDEDPPRAEHFSPPGRHRAAVAEGRGPSGSACARWPG
ncbi:hypothetical protein [Hyalangium versicolor]|uniref:hypothetical protein n=1 Tax=Hyalangium versicolor TaxID=2861190 RepID=UPI001CCEF94C|nr:hypothetical protein [Hyalangium versicolor]